MSSVELQPAGVPFIAASDPNVVTDPAEELPAAGAESGAEDLARDVAARFAGRAGQGVLQPLIERVFPGRIALVSSFGAEAAVLLSMVAEIDPAVPVLFLDSGKLFGETLRYRDELTQRLGLRDVRNIRP